MSNQEQKPHFILFPFMAPGHMIPMVDIARLLAKDGLTVTILTTHKNIIRFKPVIDRAVTSGLDIHLFHLKFPYAEAGLPNGCENFDMLPSMADAMKFCKAIAMLKDQVEKFLRELNPLPSCLISDHCFPWTTHVAQKLSIPRIIFHGMSCFSILCLDVLGNCNYFESVGSDEEYVVIPGLPDRIEITKAQYRATGNQAGPDFDEFWDQVRMAEDGAFGVVVNTFQDLEPEYVEKYHKEKGKKIWCIGPVSLCNNEESDMAERGDNSSIDKHECLKWLDSHEPGLVIYVCLGSLSRLASAQLIQLGLALEASNLPFIWVVRNVSDEFRAWLVKDKFEERIGNRGLLIDGWAPQVLILSHPSIGGFVTHCGWNSAIEGITAGVPMVTWPVLGEQFFNERFIVDVIRTGVRVGVEVPVSFGYEEEVGVLVKKDEIGRIIGRVMDGGDEEEERRRRAEKFGEMAKMAMEEGGSSCKNLRELMEDVLSLQRKRSEPTEFQNVHHLMSF